MKNKLKLISIALLINICSPFKSFAELKNVHGVTNDGSMLFIDTKEHVNQNKGWTEFIYIVLNKGKVDTRNGKTPYCYHGKVQLNPNAEKLIELSRVGWLTKIDEKIIMVEANSEASINLLNIVCSKL